MNESQKARLEDLSVLRLKYSDLTFERPIGAGSYGEVWIGDHNQSGTKKRVAIKRLHRIEDEFGAEMYCREIESLSNARHRFILPFVGFTFESPYCIVTNYIPNDSLFNALREDPKDLQLTPLDLTVIAFGIADGMAYLHGQNFIHRDLKSQNILIDETRLPVICDFGSSRKTKGGDAMKTGDIGTPNYMAPEFIEAQSYTRKVDIYSYGMILWEMVTRETPFDGLVTSQVIYKVLFHRQRPDLPASTPEGLSDLIRRSWADDPDERPEFEEIVHVFKSGGALFAGCDPQKLQERLQSFAPKPVVQLPRRKQASLDTSPPVSPQLLALWDTNVERVRGMLQVLESKVDDRSLLGSEWTGFWVAILRLLRSARADVAEQAVRLSVQLAQSEEKLLLVRKIANLETYVAPLSLDFFLYVVTFHGDLVTVPMANAIAQVGRLAGFEMKATILLYKTIAQGRSPEVANCVAKWFEADVMKHVDDECGALMLRLLNKQGRVTNEMMVGFFASKLPENIVAGYESLFVKPDDPNQLKVHQLLKHLNDDHDRLRSVALEFVRRFAAGVEGDVLVQIVTALINMVLRSSSEKADLLLCRVAADPAKAKVLVQRDLARVWLVTMPQKAAIMMRPFSVLFKHPNYRLELMSLKEVPPFLASVLGTTDVETFFAVCWSIQMARKARDFLVRVCDTAATQNLVNWILATKETRALQAATAAMTSIAQFAYSPAYIRAVPALLQLIAEGHPAAYHCLCLLERISQHKQTVDAFAIANVAGVLARVRLPNATDFVRSIYFNLKAAGYLMQGL
jgi:serine/threonine protein kinase